jgi:hypothetical protein
MGYLIGPSLERTELYTILIKGNRWICPGPGGYLLGGWSILAKDWESEPDTSSWKVTS